MELKSKYEQALAKYNCNVDECKEDRRTACSQE